jgi:hypothetical protein
VGVRALERWRGDAFGVRPAVETCAVQVALGGVVWGRDEIHPPRRFIDVGHRDRVQVAACDQCFASVARHSIGVHPPVLLRGDEKLIAVIERPCGREATKPDGDERGILIHPRLTRRSARGVGEQVAIGCLQAIQWLHQQRSRVDPLHACDVVFSRIAWQLQPSDRACTVRCHDASAYRGIRRTREHEHALPVGRPREILDLERRLGIRWRQLRRADEDIAALSRRAVVTLA